MSIDHNRIKVSDLETNQPNKILITNEQGELEFSDVSEESQNLQAVLDIGSSATGRTITLNSADTSAYPNLNSIEIGAGYSKKNGAYDWYGQNQAAETFISSSQFFVRRDSYSNHFILRPGGDYTNTFYAPDKTGGVYTLATLDDITNSPPQDLQSVLNTGNSATKNMWIGNENMQIFVGAESEDAVQLGSGGMSGQSRKSTFIGKNAGNGSTQELVTALGYYAGAGNPYPRSIILSAHDAGVPTISANQLAINTNGKSINFNTNIPIDLSLNFPSSNGTLATTSDFKTINGESIVGTGNIDLSNKQDISNQIEIGTSQVIPNSWHGKTVLFTANCTLTIPASLVASFIFNGITLPGVTVTWAITAPHTWLFGTPASTSEKQIFTLTKRGATNSILLLGV
jgi:hypothetical protein